MSWNCACGVENSEKRVKCAGCGWTQEQNLEYKKSLATAGATVDSVPTVPQEINRFNWAAFLVAPIWAAFNGAFNAPTAILLILSFVPLVGIIAGPWLAFYCGFNGNAISWKRKNWSSIEHFLDVQRKWTRWTVSIVGIIAALFCIPIVGYLISH